YLKEWFAARRFAGSGDRRAISEMVFRILRHRASLAWRMKSQSPRALATAAPPAPAPPHVVGDYPEWLEGELIRRFGDRLAEETAAFGQRAPVDLRVN